MKSYAIIAMALLVLSVMPLVMAAGAGGSLGGSIGVEEFTPIVFQCGERILSDDEIQPWRTSGLGGNLVERNNQYLFEGEKYQVDVLVFDKNKVEEDIVDMVLKPVVGSGASIMANCVKTTIKNFDACNARIDEQTLSPDPTTMQGWTCTLNVLDSEHMYGEKLVTVQAEAANGEVGEYDEVARMWINPQITLSVTGGLDFTGVRPGTAKYSTVYLKNTAQGGVMLDMFITGKDWPAADSAVGRCANVDGTEKTTGDYVNYLPLGAFRYYAENGAFSTRDDAGIGTTYSSVNRNKDAEGYININKQINAGFEEKMFNDAEIIQANPTTGAFIGGQMWNANLLYPSSTMSVTFRLKLPEPCYGEFESESDGSIFFWGEAV